MSCNDTKQYDGEESGVLELWEMRSTPSLLSLPGLLWPGVVTPNRVLSMDQIELNCVLVLNWITWNRAVLTFKLRTYAKLNCLKWNCFCMPNLVVWKQLFLTLKLFNTLNWIVWIRTVWLNWIAWNGNFLDN